MKVSEHLQTLKASQELVNSVPTNCPKCDSELEIIIFTLGYQLFWLY
jgi:hypothetical protein